MRVNGTLINYYFHCKRQCYLHGNRLNLEDNSEIVQIGKAIHEERLQSSNSEIAIENIKLDKLTKEYLTEVKKSDADVEAAKWQLLYYLSVLKNKGIYRKGKLEFVEKNKSNKKVVILELTEERENELKKIIESIDGRIQQLSNRVQEFWYNLVDDSVVKSAVSAITAIVEGGTKLVDTFSTLPVVLTAIGAGLNLKGHGEIVLRPSL